MLMIEKMITHVLNPSSNIIVCSDQCMEESDEGCLKMLETKITKAFASPQRRCGSFKEGSVCAHALEEYRSSIVSFEDMSKRLAKHIFDAKMTCSLFTPSDLLIAEVVFEERRYLIGLDNTYSIGLTHHTKQDGEEIVNSIMTYETLLSTNLVKNDSAFMIEFSDQSVSTVEAKQDINTEKQYFYGDIVLGTISKPSYKDAVKSIAKVTEAVVEQYDLKEVEVLPKMKQIIMENVEQQTDIDIQEVASILFADKPMIKAQFKEEVEKRGVQQPIPVEHMKSTKAEKVQKIRTDKGIEIIIPVDFMSSTDYVEFQNLPDGTISIQLKNINRITSK